MNTSVSVVTPCYNVEAFVVEAVKSAVHQTHRPLEVICVDDGSTDGTLAVLRGLEAEYPGLIHIVAQENGGPQNARNTGLAAARGEFVQFLDADDVLHANKLSHQLGLATGGRDRDVDLVVAAHTHLEADGTEHAGGFGVGDPWRDLFMHGMGITSANLFRRAKVKEVGGWDEEQPSSQEYELMFRMLKSGSRVAYDYTSHTTIRARSGSIRHSSESFLTSVKLRADILEHVRRHGLVSDAVEMELCGAAFRSVRAEYSVNPEAALRAHDILFPDQYTPRPDAFNTRPYVWAYQVLGLAGAEALKRLMRRKV